MFPPKKHINRGIAINCPPVSSNLAGKSLLYGGFVRWEKRLQIGDMYHGWEIN
jgi:hypothetical protein